MEHDDRFVTLAETLGTAPASAGPSDAETSVSQLMGITDARAFAKAVLESVDFRRYIVNALTLGELPAAVITRLMDYAWGKPADRLEITTIAVEALTPERLEVRANELQEMARYLRRAEQFDEPLTSDSVH